MIQNIFHFDVMRFKEYLNILFKRMEDNPSGLTMLYWIQMINLCEWMINIMQLSLLQQNILTTILGTFTNAYHFLRKLVDFQITQMMLCTNRLENLLKIQRKTRSNTTKRLLISYDILTRIRWIW